MFKNMAKKRLILLLVSLSLILAAGVGVTLALIIDQSGDVENVFEPSRVSCAVVEDQKTNDAPTGQVEVETKTNVKIKNTGDTDAYIRAAIIVNWKKADGTVWAQAPADEDYTMTIGSDWTKVGDFYYYKSSVIPGDTTTNLIVSATQVNSAPEEGYYLSIEIVASAIQSSLADTAQGAWEAAKSN